MLQISNKTVIAIVEEPGDMTRYNHVFEFSWNRTQFQVHEHPFDSGCTIKNTNRVLDVNPLVNLFIEIRGKDRFEQLKIANENAYIKAMLADENPNTVCSVVRCLGFILGE